MLAFAIAAAAALTAAGPPAAEPTAVHQTYVVRHLEKAEGDDPPLSEKGAERAGQLAELLADSEIAAIFATETRRAMETAAPLAQKLRLRVRPYDPRDPDALVGAARQAGGPVLVVGHSNTVPDLVARFGGPAQPPLSEEDYGTIFIVAPDGTVTRMELR